MVWTVTVFKFKKFPILKQTLELMDGRVSGRVRWWGWLKEKDEQRSNFVNNLVEQIGVSGMAQLRESGNSNDWIDVVCATRAHQKKEMAQWLAQFPSVKLWVWLLDSRLQATHTVRCMCVSLLENVQSLGRDASRDRLATVIGVPWSSWSKRTKKQASKNSSH